MGDPDRGGWIQVVLASEGFTRERIDVVTIPLDSIEDKRSRSQVVGAIGWSAPAFRGSLTSRTFRGEGGFQSMTGRMSMDHRVAGIAAFAEWRGKDSSSLGEVAARFSPFSFLSVTGVAGVRRAPSDTDAKDVRSARGEIGCACARLWLTGGLVRLDSIHVTAPRSSTRRS